MAPTPPASQFYLLDASQSSAGGSSDNPPPLQYQEPVQLYNPVSSQNLALAVQNYYNYVAQCFRISFKPNDNSLKNPNQVLFDDTLHCAPNKSICVYLGQKIFPYDGINFPQVIAYLKYADDKNKNSRVETCIKHNKGPPPTDHHVIYSDDVDCNHYYDKNRSAFALSWIYPAAEEIPSISICFTCSSSCFQRAVFELHIDLIYPDGTYIPQKHLVKVSANPGRDSGYQMCMLNEFARMKGAWNAASKPRARKMTQTSESEDSPKAKRSDADVEEDLIGNGVFNITVYGFKAFKNVLEFYSMLNTKDKYELLKLCPNQAGVLNSQIPANGTLDAWLEKARMKKYKGLLNSNGIRSMVHVHKVYHSNYFENLGIPIEDAGSLHASFIYWRTSYLMALYKDVEPPQG
uniref:P53 DNA-binding domain-containing protein n=1 Tax=Panagrolaimus superbus TaxID=310955 RepID=A0A914YNQ5_9BILA